MPQRERLRSYVEKLAAYLKKSPNALFEDNPEILDNLINENWDANVDFVKSQIEKGLKEAKEHESVLSAEIGCVGFEWNDMDHDSFTLYLGTENVYEQWMECDLGDFANIDVEPVLSRIFKDIEERTEELHDDLNDINDLMEALLEVAVSEAWKENLFQILNCKKDLIIISRLWHDVEWMLIAADDDSEQSGNLYRVLDYPPEVDEEEDEGDDENEEGIKIGREVIKTDSRWLRCRGAGIRKLPEEIGMLTDVEEVELGDNNIESIPDSFWKLKKVEKLALQNNKIGEISENISELKEITHLDLTNNKLKSLPGSLSALERLESLHLGYNELSELPEEMYKLSSLTMIELHYNKLSRLPELPQSLEWLQLLNNRLSDLPSSLAKLTRLETLTISENNFTEIPEVVFRLENLESITLGGNPVTEVPEKLMQLPKLREVHIYPNKFSIEERKVLREKYGERIFLGYDTDEKSFMK